MLKKILIGLVGALVGLVVLIALQPDSFTVERSLTMTAPPAAVYAQVVDFQKWVAWSPWEKMDPTMKKEYSGQQGAPGAGYHWVGNDEVGEGRMTLTEAKANERVGINLEFIKPFAATNLTTFEFAPDGAGTKVTWRMEGKHNFFSKAMWLVMSMDKMVGGDFEKGLAGMQVAAAAAPPAAAPASEATAKPAATASDAGH